MLKLGFLILVLSFSTIYTSATNFHPISDSHRLAAKQLFISIDGSFGSLEETYEALKTFQVLSETGVDVSSVCPLVGKVLESSDSTTKDVYFALKVNSILKCDINAEVLKGITSKLLTDVKNAESLLDFYYKIGSLVLIKNQGLDVVLGDADGTFHSIKALSQSDGKWRYSFNGADSSTYAAGLALETLAGVVSLASSEIDQSMIGTVKNDILKLFESLQKYDDGAQYFDEKLVAGREHQGPLSTSSSVVHGMTAFSAVTSGTLNVPGDKILGLAKFFLGIGVPGNSKDLFNQIDSLACLENNKISIPLILSLPATVLSLTKKDKLKVKVNTVFGSEAPPLTVKLVQAVSSNSKGSPVVENQELEYDTESASHYLDISTKGFDVGKHTFVFRVLLNEHEHKSIYSTGGQTQIPIFVTGFIKVDAAEIAVLDSDLGSIETKKKLDLSVESALSLSANHLQKLRLSFQLATPFDHSFKPHQVFLKLKHESKVEHVFLLSNTGKKFEAKLDFLGLVEKLYYLSGPYEMHLTVGDTAMENSFIRCVGHLDLDLPEAPEKATRPPLQPIEAYTRFGPKQEIHHIFRVPDKRPPQELSFIFTGLTFLPLIGFLIGLISLGVNFKNFPTSVVPATFSILFHAGLAAILSLYLLFWMKLDLFTTLKTLGFLGIFLVFVGHRTLSHLASVSTKLKSA